MKKTYKFILMASVSLTLAGAATPAASGLIVSADSNTTSTENQDVSSNGNLNDMLGQLFGSSTDVSQSNTNLGETTLSEPQRLAVVKIQNSLEENIQDSATSFNDPAYANQLVSNTQVRGKS